MGAAQQSNGRYGGVPHEDRAEAAVGGGREFFREHVCDVRARGDLPDPYERCGNELVNPRQSHRHVPAVAVDFVGIRVVDDWLVVDVDVHGWNAERRDAEFREDYEYGEHRLDGEHCGDGFGVTRTERDARLQLGAEGEGKK